MVGEHYFLDISGASPKYLDDEEYLKKLLEAGAAIAGATVLKTESYKFDPQGVTAFCLLSESHISIHTWPETGKAALDMFTCGDCDSQAGVNFIAWGLDGVITSSSLAYRCNSDLVVDYYEP